VPDFWHSGKHVALGEFCFSRSAPAAPCVSSAGQGLLAPDRPHPTVSSGTAAAQGRLTLPSWSPARPPEELAAHPPGELHPPLPAWGSASGRRSFVLFLCLLVGFDWMNLDVRLIGRIGLDWMRCVRSLTFVGFPSIGFGFPSTLARMQEST
jgi:hypothetical protein